MLIFIPARQIPCQAIYNENEGRPADQVAMWLILTVSEVAYDWSRVDQKTVMQ